jgi:transposase
MAVEWGCLHHNLSGVQAIGVDEIAWKTGRKYLTLVYQIDSHYKRKLWIGKVGIHLYGYVETLSEGDCQESGQAIHVLDRFHIMAHLSKALDEVRAGEARELKAKGYEPVLTKTRWLLLKRSENLSEKQEVKLSELLQYNLRSVRAYLLKNSGISRIRSCLISCTWIFTRARRYPRILQRSWVFIFTMMAPNV